MVDDEDSPSRLSRSLSARFRRKEQVARGEQVAETREEEEAALAAAGMPDAAESEEDAGLDDEQLLEKYGLTNPEEIEDEAGLEAFMEKGLPDRLRQMALRRMWRLNPLFRFADEMVEYGENYTDAATVIDGMTTAYQVGKGYLQKTLDAIEEAGEAGTDDGAAAATSLDPGRADAAGPAGDGQGGAKGDQAADRSAAEERPQAPPAEAGADAGRSDRSVLSQRKHGGPAPDGGEGNSLADEALSGGETASESPEAEDKPRPRPQRMAFRRQGGQAG